jgi:hypothetical protein
LTVKLCGTVRKTNMFVANYGDVLSHFMAHEQVEPGWPEVQQVRKVGGNRWEGAGGGGRPLGGQGVSRLSELTYQFTVFNP